MLFFPARAPAVRKAVLHRLGVPVDRGNGRCTQRLLRVCRTATVHFGTEYPEEPGVDTLMIVDCHTHLNRIDGSTIAGCVDALCRYGDRLGIDRFCLSLGFGREHSPTPEQVREHNDQVLEALKLRPDRFIGFVYLNPRYTDEALAEIERCVVDGPMRGIKLWVACRCNDPLLDPIVERAMELDLPILQHTWLKATGNLPHESTAADLAELAARHPEAKLVCGHTGGDWEHGIMAIRPYPNVFADVCGGAPYAGLVELAVRELGADRVLYGSDAPGRSFASQLAKVLAADVSDEDKEKILGRNILRLLPPERNPLPIPNHEPDTSASARHKRMPHPISPPPPRACRPVVDVNAGLGNWPFRQLRYNTPESLTALMQRLGIDQACVASLDAVFHRETKSANIALAESVAAFRSRLLPLAVINPVFPGWRQDLDFCLDRLDMCGVRTYPNYFGCALDDPCFADLLRAVGERGVPLQIAVRISDERMHHPLVKVPPADIARLQTHLPLAGNAPVILLNVRQAELAAAIDLCRSHENVFIEISHVETIGGLRRLFERMPARQILFGTHAPIQIALSAVLKLHESDLSDEQLRALCHGNAARFCPGVRADPAQC